MPRCRMCNVTFVDTAPPSTTSKIAPPRDRSALAIGKWVQAMGGTVRRGDKGIRYISLARTRVTDADSEVSGGAGT